MPDNKEEIEQPEQELPEEEEAPAGPPDLAGYGRRAYDIGRKRFGRKPAAGAGGLEKGAGKAAAAGAGKAAGSATGAAAGTAVGGPLGTVLGAATGWLTSRLAERFGPSAVKWVFYILLAILGLVMVFAFASWGFLGLGKYFGGTPSVPAKQSTINRALAYAGDPIKLRELIVEESPELKKQLEAAKQGVDKIDKAKLSEEKKKTAKEKITKAIELIDKTQKLLSGTGSEIAKAAEENVVKLGALLNELREVVQLVAVRGDFYLPLGSLTCATGHNKQSSPHTLAATGHGVYISGGLGALDYFAPKGTPVYAITNGRITEYRWHPVYKNWIIIFRSEDGHYQTAYAHITKELKTGDTVTKGQVIGHLMKGAMSNPHLHFELWIDRKPIGERAQLPYFCGG